MPVLRRVSETLDMVLGRTSGTLWEKLQLWGCGGAHLSEAALEREQERGKKTGKAVQREREREVSRPSIETDEFVNRYR